MKKPFSALLIIFLLFQMDISACTTAIIAGKYTVNGKPLLFKHRDSGFLQNKLMYFEDGRYKYIGLVNSVDKEGKEVWAGVNSAGFAIMNSASYNLNGEDGVRVKDREGIVMKLALQNCASLADFEKLLDTLQKPLGVEANFGVIDAFGGAAYYETGHSDYIKIDVNDPAIAPFGYMIRTNYSFTGRRDEGYGYIRYQTANDLLAQAAAENNISHEFIFREVSRSMKHSLRGVDLTENMAISGAKAQYEHFEDFIPRSSSCSSVIIEGVNEDDDPEKATMWTALGFPLTSVAMPVWVKGGSRLPEILMSDNTGVAPLCDVSLELKKKCYPVTRGSGDRYLNTAALFNKQGDGIMQQLRNVEDEIFVMTKNQQELWKGNPQPDEIKAFYDKLDGFVKEEYRKRFGLIL